MSTIFLLPVCLTYWPKKYTTRIDPHVNNSHQVWSWYDHTLTSYSVFVCWYVTWPWPFDLEQVLCMADLATKYEDPTPIRSWVTSYNVFQWVGGQKQLHIWNPRPRFAYSLYNFYWATTTIKGRLLSSVTNAKALDSVNFLCVTLWPSPLTFWPWTVVVHGESRGQPCHQVWRPYAYPFLSYEL